MTRTRAETIVWPERWQEHPAGGAIPDGGNSVHYKPGGWRNDRPVWHEDVCSHCLICWIYCPHSAILVEDGQMVGIDFDHCKGCGICAHECPKAGSLEMVPEREEVV